jgi:hypothetical protein
VPALEQLVGGLALIARRLGGFLMLLAHTGMLARNANGISRAVGPATEGPSTG